MFHCFCLFHFVLFIIFLFQHSNIPKILILLFVFYASFDVITVLAVVFVFFWFKVRAAGGRISSGCGGRVIQITLPLLVDGTSRGGALLDKTDK